MTVSKQKQNIQTDEQENWTLTPEQILFMLRHHNAIETAYAQEDVEFLRTLSQGEEFGMLFGDMGFDEAYDRYESTIEGGDAA